MFGIVYLTISIFLGRELFARFFYKREQTDFGGANPVWFYVPAWFGAGTLFMTWGVYVISGLFSVYGGIHEPLYYGNLIMLILGCVIIFLLHRQNRPESFCMVSDIGKFKKEAVLFAVTALFVTCMMFYVFHIKDGYLYSGFTVYGDYAPHTAMMRSFSWGNNFPTQYPHFGGEDVKYHFMFQFLAGNLEYLGFPIDWAFNLVSILSLIGFLMLLYLICCRTFQSFLAGVIAILFFFFRSSFSFFRFVWEHIQAGDLWNTLSVNTAFIGYTPNENWGLWNFNVYLNQRHLAFGLLIAAVCILLFWDWLKDGTAGEKTGFMWIKERVFSREAWISKNWRTGLLVGILLGLCAFWNGAAEIAGLLILCGMALWSNGKLDYLLAAVTAVCMSVLQTKLFIDGNAVGFQFQWGFICENKSIPGVLEFLFWMSGLVFLGTVVLVFFQKRVQRCLLMAFLLPLAFAFSVSLTPDVTVNHKYIMISMHFVSVLWAGFVARLFRQKWHVRTVAVILTIILTITGIYDFCVILMGNDSNHRVGVNLSSDLSAWLRENTNKDDLLLTPEYSMNEVTIAGVMLYCGWPYYAWSAGYDTYYRAGKAKEMYTTGSEEELKQLVEEEGITMIVFEEGSEFEGSLCREDVIAQVYPLTYTSENGRIRIYETR